MVLRGVSFVALAVADSYPLLLVSIVLAALGGGLFESPKAAAIAALTDEANRSRFYALAGVVSGLGITLGTQTGALLIEADFALVSLVGAGCFAVAFLLVLVLLPPVRVGTKPAGVAHGLAMALRDRTFVSFNALLMGYWFIWTQFFLSLPLAATAIAGTSAAIAWIFAINSGVTVSLGYALPRLVERRLRPLPMLILGVALTAVGFGALAAAGSVPVLLGCVATIALGTVLARPADQTIAAGLADPAARGAYFGAAALSLAVGGGAGNFAGGVIYDLGLRLGEPALPWLVFGVIGAATTFGLGRMGPTIALRLREPALVDARPRTERLPSEQLARGDRRS
jgi:DHA1 family multidrug resistance protein-like MFS transporter